MAEGGIPADHDENETMSSFTEAPPSAADILIMNVEELKTELRARGVAYGSGTKPELQMMLLQSLGYVTDPLPDLQDGHSELDPESDDLQLEEAPQPGTTMTAPSDPSVRPLPDYTLPLPARLSGPPLVRSSAQPRESTDSTDAVRTLELQLQLRRLEIEEAERQRRFQTQQAEREDKQRQWEAQQRQWEAQERAKDRQFENEERQRQFELRRLELQRSQAPPVAARRDGPSAFKVENAVRLIPRFTDQDIETFLISFEKIAALNNFPREKYSAILQAHLTGKALKVFTELSTEECQNYDTLKKALLTAYAVVPEVYRKRFRASSKTPC